MKHLIVVALLSLLLPLAHAAEQPIKFGALNWESGQFSTALLRLIVEKGYQHPTQEVSGAGVALENALIQNDIQVIGEVWAGRSEVLDQAIAENKVHLVGDTLKGGATQGWYVPDYVHQNHPDLRSVDDLQLSQFQRLFADPNRPEKSRFLNCPTGWTCEIFNTRLLHNLKLNQQYQNILPGTGAALDSEISAYYEQKKPLLFYYWQPTGLMAKYHFVPLAFPKHNAACWAELLKADSRDNCVSGFPVSHLKIAVSQAFANQHPDLYAFFSKFQLEADELNRQILDMSEHKRTGEEQALHFLQQHPERLQQWIAPEIANRLHTQLFPAAENGFFPTWSIQHTFNQSLKQFVHHYGDYFRSISHILQNHVLHPVAHFLTILPPWLFIAVMGLVVWHSTRKLLFTVFSGIGLFLIGAFGLWEAAMQTVALMLVSIGLTVLVGIPLGVALSKSPHIYKWIVPLLDVMQTMPSFVYLIPVLMLFGLGEVPAVFACMIYAIVPLIRLTVLGIQQIDAELLETGHAFGSNRWQMLVWVVLPLAKAQIMAGINQTVMMSLSMVVLASMIGASGLGQIILQAIQTLNVGQGIQAGGAIVILAIMVDRITQGYGAK